MSTTPHWYEQILFRHRDRLLASWGIAVTIIAWPPEGLLLSVVPLACGILLRLWARAHIGPHSRGRFLTSPERCAGGPYRYLAHPLYAANLLALSALALALAGPGFGAIAILSGPTALYLLLGRAESRLLRVLDPPVRATPLPRAERRLGSEWASILPPVVLWALLQASSR